MVEKGSVCSDYELGGAAEIDWQFFRMSLTFIWGCSTRYRSKVKYPLTPWLAATQVSKRAFTMRSLRALQAAAGRRGGGDRG